MSAGSVDWLYSSNAIRHANKLLSRANEGVQNRKEGIQEWITWNSVAKVHNTDKILSYRGCCKLRDS